ncbi:MAG: acyl-CoA/acyl-ACP dehydrogenase [Planctomycetota bacterium]|nr:acyl-CoA/acyl-ACP dehydrogenase [Planctomycetota bacterium]
MYIVDADQKQIVDGVCEIVRSSIAPNCVETDATGTFPKASVQALADAGYFGLTLPKDVGGMAQPPRVFTAVVEEIAQACASTAMIYVMHVSATQGILHSKTLDDREPLLRDIASGKHLTTLAFSERGSRSQFWAPVSRLTANQNGDGFTTNAMKSWITSASHASSYVSSVQKPDAESPMEVTVYLARPDAKGIEIGTGFDGLGLRGNDSLPVTFNEMSVAKSELMTQQGEGSSLMLEVLLPWFAIGTAAMANGLSRAAVSATAAHLSATGFEHTNSQLRDLPNLRSRLADMSVRTEQSRALLAHTVAEMENPTEITPLYVLQSRLAAIEAAADVTDLAMKACGGAAFSKHLGIERLFRDARAGWIMAPTADHLRDFVGRALTGMPLFG